MFKITATNGSEVVEIHNDVYPGLEVKVINPKLELTESNAGSFTTKIPPTNPGYDSLERFVTLLKIYRNDEEIWAGRILSVKEDFYKNRTITCEGELAYLNDTTSTQNAYEKKTIREVLNIILGEHNSKVEARRQINVGNITVSIADTIDFVTNYETPMKLINDNLVAKYGGYIQLRKQNGKLYLDYLSTGDRPTTDQKIEFGTNLLDFTKSYDSTDFCTVVVPLGARLDDVAGTPASGIEGISAYTTVEDANDGSIYILNEEGVNKYGRIEKIVHWDKCDDPEVLLELGQEYLSSIQFDDMQLEVSAVDLGYMNINSDNIKLSDKVRVVSKVHGLDKEFPVTKISIPLDNPGNTSFTMGLTTVGSLTAKTNNGAEIIKDITDENNPDVNERFEKYKRDILDEAKRKAAEFIESCTTGYITIAQRTGGWNEFYITDKPIKSGYDPDNPVSDPDIRKYWRWNLHGLGFFNKDDQGKYWDTDRQDLKIAITMNGEIDAHYITTGILQAGIIKTGIIQSNGTYRDNWWDLDTGELHIGSSATMKDNNGDTVTFSSWVDRTATGITGAMSKAKEASDALTTFENQYSIDAEGIRGSISTLSSSISSKMNTSDFQSKFNYALSATGIQASIDTIENNYYNKNNYSTDFEYNAKNLNIYFQSESASRSLVSEINYSANAIKTKVTTGEEFTSEFNQNFDNITLSVKGSTTGTDTGSIESLFALYKDRIYYKVGTDNIHSAIELSQYNINLKAGGSGTGNGKIIITGDNFSVDNDGHLTCYGANIYGELITGGKNTSSNYIHIIGTQMFGYDPYGGESEINFHGSVGGIGNRVITLKGNAVSLSVNNLGITSNEGDTSVAFGLNDNDFISLNSNGNLYKHEFTHGIMTHTEWYKSLQDYLIDNGITTGGSSDISGKKYIYEPGSWKTYTFKNGIVTAIEDRSGTYINGISGTYGYLDEYANYYKVSFKDGMIVRRTSGESTTLLNQNVTFQLGNNAFYITFKNGLAESVTYR